MTRATLLCLICLFALAPLLVAQTPMTNDDVVKLGKAGLSEDFVLNLIQQQPSAFATDADRLVELKSNGLSERLILAMVRKDPPQEPLTSYAVIQLAQAKFSDSFLLELLNTQPVRISTDTANIVRLKQAGLSERVLARIVNQGSSKQLAQGTEVVVRLIDAIDSERSREGDTFRASLEEPLSIGGNVVAPKDSDAMVRLAQNKESGKMTGKTELTVELVTLTINGKPVQVNTSSVSQSSGSQGVKTAKTAAAVGAVGAIIGAIAGGGKGAAIGATSGAAVGAGSQVFLGGQRVLIPSETVLTFTTASPVEFQ